MIQEIIQIVVLIKELGEEIQAFRDELESSKQVMDTLATGLMEASKTKSESEVIKATLNHLKSTLESYKKILKVIQKYPMYISCLRKNTYRQNIEDHVKMVTNMLPMLNLTLIQTTAEIALDVKNVLNNMADMKKEIEALIASNLKLMGEKKIDMDTKEVQEVMSKEIGAGWFQSKEDLHKEGLRLQKEGKFQEALVVFLKYRNELRKNDEEDETIETANMYSEMGQAHVRQGQYDEAEKYYSKEILLRKKLLPPSDISFGRLNNNMGKLYNLQAKFDQALEVLEKAWLILKVIDSEGVDAAHYYNNLGNVYYNLGHYEKAKEYYEKTLTIKLSALEPEHPDVCLLYTSPSPRDRTRSRMPSSA